jgi:hypothetical protein
MLEIPPAKNTDAEDVAWGLQTAETLWKRGERIDALVWLRRAAQAAGDANDDDRALELARFAAELTDWMANNEETNVTPLRIPPPEEHAVDDAPIDVDVSLPPPIPDDSTAATPIAPMIEMSSAEGGLSDDTSATLAPVAAPPSEDDEGRPSATSVPPAETVHAGMFDPWADPRLAKANPPPPARNTSVVETDDEEEVVTSVRPAAISRPEASSTPEIIASAPPPPAPVEAAPPAPAKPLPPRPGGSKPPPLPPRAAPPPLPPRARPPAPSQTAPQAPTPPRAPSIAPVSMDEPELISIPPSAPGDVEAISIPPAAPPVRIAESAPPVAAMEAPEPAPAPAPVEASPALDLDSVDAFADLPDDARSAFAAAATLHSLAEGEEIGSFALAYVLSGSFDVAATVVDAPAVRLASGAVLRARGTTDENVPIRLICAGANGVIATWSDASVDEAFRSIPWVEEDLRAAADRVQTLVGITIGPLGERLDASIREQIVGRLTMRPLIAGEVVVKEGDAVPGLLLVGIGELELVKAEKVVGAVSSGDFLFPSEVLGAGSAPSTARAGSGGALVLFGDRGIAQELLVTCPPLLELFAGM